MKIRVAGLLMLIPAVACMEDNLLGTEDKPSTIVGVVGAALEEDCPNGGVVTSGGSVQCRIIF